MFIVRMLLNSAAEAMRRWSSFLWASSFALAHGSKKSACTIEAILPNTVAGGALVREIFIAAWSVATIFAACLTLPGTGELLCLTVAAMFRVKRVGPAEDVSAHSPWRVAVVVPAHDEEASIASCVESLLAADAGGMQVTVYVIADNCTDATAIVAEAAGARVMVRQDAEMRGKGHALHYAFQHLEYVGFDCVLVVDADTIVASNFVVAAAGAMQRGAAAVQVRYVARNAEQGTRTRLMALALRAFNVVRPRGRENLGLSVGILGNGFGLRRETLAAVPYLAASVVEDLDYHIALVRSGRRVRFVDESAVYGEMPVRGKGVKTQRSRWEGGRLRMLRERGAGLAADVTAGRWESLEPLLELLLLPLAFHVLLLLLAMTSPLLVVREFGLVGFVVVLMHLVVAIRMGNNAGADVVALATAPFYVLWKIMLIPSLLKSAGSKQAWVRTSRNDEER
jgi:cellulose synthase/poly-beta-1,6-N-acetylglucosamine synthase-like glycosyltransferase